MTKLLRVISNFSGGLSEVGNDNMKDNELVEAQNAVPGETYGIARAEGCSIFDRIAVSGTPIKETVLRLIELRSYKSHEDGTTLTEPEDQILAFTDILSGVGPDDPPPSEGQDESLYCGTGYLGAVTWKKMATNFRHFSSWFIRANCLYWVCENGINKYNGYQTSGIIQSDLTFGGTPDADTKTAFFNKLSHAISVAERNGRWFYATGDSEVIYSEAGDPLSFYVTNIVNVNTPDNDKLTALHTFNDALLIFKERSVFALTGVDLLNGTDIKLTRLNVESGTRYPSTIQTVENAVMYLGRSGVYRLYTPYYSSVTASTNVAEKKITGRLNDLIGAVAAVWNGVYHLSLVKRTVDEGGRETRWAEEYRYYLTDKAFWGAYDLDIYGYAPGMTGDGNLYFGTKNGYILYIDKNSHNYIDTTTGLPRNIAMVVKTKAYDVVGAVFANSKVKRALIAARQYESESSDLYIQIKADYADEANNVEIDGIEEMIGDALGTHDISFDESLIWQEGSWAEERWGWTDTVFKQIPIGRKTKHFQFILKASAQQPLTVYALGILYKRKKVKGNSDGVTSVEVID